MGLKQNLYSEIQQKGVISYEEAEQIAKREGRKIDNMTRRLRELMESGLIEPIRNEKRIITGYRYISKDQPSVKIMQFNQGNLFR